MASKSARSSRCAPTPVALEDAAPWRSRVASLMVMTPSSWSRRKPKCRPSALDRGLGQGAMGVAPRGGAVVELVHRGVEEVGRHLGGAIGQEPHRLLARPANEALARRDLTRQVGQAGPEGGVELHVAAEDGQEARFGSRACSKAARRSSLPRWASRVDCRSSRPMRGSGMGPMVPPLLLDTARGVATSHSFRGRCPIGRNLWRRMLVFFARRP